MIPRSMSCLQVSFFFVSGKESPFLSLSKPESLLTVCPHLTLPSLTPAHHFSVGPYTDNEHISPAISDILICFEMPFFAIAHMFAFSHTDYIDKNIHYAARMPFFYAVRDAFGLLDVLEDSRATFHGSVSYRTFEPVEGGIHVGSGRDRRIRAGLRYAKGGKQKYWLPLPQKADSAAVAAAPLQAGRRPWDPHRGYASLMAEQAEDVVHEGPSYRQSQYQNDDAALIPDYIANDDDNLSLDFGSPQEDEDMMYDESRKLLFGDYNYPVIDVSSEAARRLMWDEEERILSDERAAAWGWKGGRATAAYSGTKGYGATDIESQNPLLRKPSASGRPYPAIIDYDNERVPDIDVHGVRLKWTKAGTAVPHASSRRSSSRSKGGLMPGRLSDPATPSNKGMPKNAVDLVAEGSDAVIQEVGRGRGGPALEVGTGVKKVDRRTYHQGTSREVGKRSEDSPNDEMPVKIRDETDSPWGDEVLRQPREAGVTIGRRTEPPPRTRIESRNEYRGLSGDDTNPWA